MSRYLTEDQKFRIFDSLSHKKKSISNQVIQKEIKIDPVLKN